MSNWIEGELGDVADWGAGGTPSRANMSYYKGNIPWIKSGELNNKYIKDTEEKISEDAVKNSSAKLYPKGSVAIAMYGATIGKTSILSIDATCNQAVAVARPKEGVITSDFLYYFFLHVNKKLINLGQGGAQPNISQQVLKKFPFKYPNIKVQNKITSKIELIFSKVDFGIKELTNVHKKLDIYKQSILNSAIRGKLVPQDPKDEPASKLLERIQKEKEKLIAEKKIKKEKPLPPISEDEIPFELPEGWVWTRLGDLKIYSIYGPRFSSDDYSVKGVPVLRTTDIDEYGHVNIDTAPKLSLKKDEIEKYKLHPFDLLITRTGSIGTLSIFEDTIDAIPGAYLIQYRVAQSKLISKWILKVLESPYGQSQLLKGSRGIGITNINVPTIDNFIIPIPPANMISKLISKIDSFKSDMKALEAILRNQLQDGQKLKQSILKKAFEGELV